MTDDEHVNQPEAPLTLRPAAEDAPVHGAPAVTLEAEPGSQTEDVFGFAAQVGFDPGLWFAKTLEFWEESFQALTDHSSDLAKTGSLEEAIELQTRFAIARLDQLNRQIRELLNLVTGGVSVATLWGAPRETRTR
jgi:hypothetical protein